MAGNREITFDIMKGFGILLVITAHFFSWNHPLLGRIITSFHMPMFFLVAGYFSKSCFDWDEVGQHVRKYAKRLLPAFVFTQILIILWAVLMALTQSEGWNLVIKETLSLLWADPYGPSTPWGTLSIGVIWFLLALFFAKSILLVLSRMGAWAIPVSILLSLGAVLLFKAFPHSIWCLSLGLTSLPFITIGWWIRTHKLPIWIVIFCIVCWIAAILFSKLDMYEMEWRCYPLDFLGALGGSFFLYIVCKFIGQQAPHIGRIFATLGLWSLAIMCFHDLETSCHLGNHVMALFPFTLPVWGKFVFRYLLTIAMAAVAVKTPILKRVFV